jgi:hypothetical protein
LAALIAEMLTSKELSSSDRKLLRDTLDVLLDMDTEEQKPNSYGRLVAEAKEFDKYKVDQPHRKCHFFDILALLYHKSCP